ncbi:MAG: [Fe-Fe] hydrogenase large subunit C-terminal domain-containing protein [Sphaerochaeta sp.]|uniref:[Fe-Fe] hydrogenase large subunit C-terminal domain-containing protein n=1 Tax=Sphaerochaeta sp. TaxID=1972642 RepID=UPI002FC7BC04
MNEHLASHALEVLFKQCRGCTHCMKVCPTSAIRIQRGKAFIKEELCIDCGQCLASCPNHAIRVQQESLSKIEQFTYRCAIIPAAFFAQFPESITPSQVLFALGKLGFTHTYLAETGVDILSHLQKEARASLYPLISNYCPAVVHLIQIRFPLLVENLGTLRPPAQVTALFARSELASLGGTLGIFYLTPCAAKIAQFRTEGSEEGRLFDGILKFDTVFNQINAILAKQKSESGARNHELTFPYATQQSLLWSLVKGELVGKGGRTLAVDEMHNVIEFLEILEDSEQTNLQFLELEACAEGCVGGILTIRNRFLASESLRHWADSLPSCLPEQAVARIEQQRQNLAPNLHLSPFEAKAVLGLDSDHTKALHKMEKVEQIVSALPGIDCALCGSPSCRVLAEDIAKGDASIRQCVVLKLKDPKQLNALAKIWGRRTTGAIE